MSLRILGPRQTFQIQQDRTSSAGQKGKQSLRLQRAAITAEWGETNAGRLLQAAQLRSCRGPQLHIHSAAEILPLGSANVSSLTVFMVEERFRGSFQFSGCRIEMLA